MNAKTLEAIKRHGEALLIAFPNATEKNPVALCKKLRRIETAVSRVTLQACNGPEVTEAELDAACDKAQARATVLLGEMSGGCGNTANLLINRDPRGYALKLDSKWTHEHNNPLYRAGKGELAIQTDMGGFGILAPDLNND